MQVLSNPARQLHSARWRDVTQSSLQHARTVKKVSAALRSYIIEYSTYSDLSQNFPSASCPALDSLTSLAHQTRLFRFWQCLSKPMISQCFSPQDSLNELAVKPSTTGTSQSVIRHPTPQGTFEAWDVESQTLDVSALGTRQTKTP